MRNRTRAGVFADRVDAGRRLAERFAHLRGADVVVVGLPRGGVPVAAEVATALGAPLDVIVVRKLGVPFQPELGMGAIGEDGVRVVNDEVDRPGPRHRRRAGRGRAARASRARAARQAVPRRPRAAIPLAGPRSSCVDDGIATGSTARAACEVARAEGAVPGRARGAGRARGSWTSCLAGAADEFVCVDTPEPFFGVGQFYADFAQTTDDEVDRLPAADARATAHASGDGPGG